MINLIILYFLLHYANKTIKQFPISVALEIDWEPLFGTVK